MPNHNKDTRCISDNNDISDNISGNIIDNFSVNISDDNDDTGGTTIGIAARTTAIRINGKTNRADNCNHGGSGGDFLFGNLRAEILSGGVRRPQPTEEVYSTCDECCVRAFI